MKEYLGAYSREEEEDVFETGWEAFGCARWRERGRANVGAFWENRGRLLLAEILAEDILSLHF